ncbi:hypothetical protein B0189_03250 [Moraxella cuniculi]|nr:hypothetical protein B0189_03250 [Moraxella cuniculi]
MADYAQSIKPCQYHPTHPAAQAITTPPIYCCSMNYQTKMAWILPKRGFYKKVFVGLVLLLMGCNINGV